MTDAAFWDKAAPKYARDPISDPAAYEHTLGRMRELLQPDHAVLELGCGTGSTALELAAGVRTYLGTDLSSGMIRIARGKLDANAPDNLAFEVAEAGRLPDQSFDAILALNLLHLVPDLEQVVQQIHDALPSGGLFIAKTGLLRDGKWFLRPMVSLMRMVGKAPFVRSMTRDELIGILTDTGFVVDEALLQPDIAPRLFTVARKP